MIYVLIHKGSCFAFRKLQSVVIFLEDQIHADFDQTIKFSDVQEWARRSGSSLTLGQESDYQWLTVQK